MYTHCSFRIINSCLQKRTLSSRVKSFIKFILVLQWRRQWHPTPVLVLGKSHGRRSLVGCSPWGCRESDTTEWLHFHFSLSCIGEGNGNPLQCSCLENPRDRGVWWAAIYGVKQSRTQLKWLSSSSSSSHWWSSARSEVHVTFSVWVNFSQCPCFHLLSS